jgi:hypothetical protein
MSKPQIIIIKRAKGHGGHHGGAWKVAYADFVTAMMALFIVLWLLNTSEHTKKVIAGYFNDPMGKPTESGSDRAGDDDSLPMNKQDIEKLKQQLQKQIGAGKPERHLETSRDDYHARGAADRASGEQGRHFFRHWRYDPEGKWQGHSEPACGQACSCAESNFYRGPYRFSGVFGRGNLFQLGALRRPGECGASTDATRRRFATKPGFAGAWFCRPTIANSRHTPRSIESAGLAYCPVPYSGRFPSWRCPGSATARSGACE